MKKILCILILFIWISSANGQVGIGTDTPDPSAQLDVTSTSKGMLVPRVNLSSTTDIVTIPSPATGLLVYNLATAGTGVTAVLPGFYVWNGSWQKILQASSGWQTTGNNLTATGSFGTSSNNHIDLYTNATVRGRITNTGNFFWGSTTARYGGDMFDVTSSSTYPFAINGLSAYNGSGVYGSVTGGTTMYPGVFGDYSGTAPFNSAAIKGNNNNSIGGTGFRTLSTTGPRMGISGTTTATTGTYTFGVHGSFASTASRCGAVFGDDFGIAAGAIGYYASNLVDYSIYGFGLAYQNGISGGRNNEALNEPNTQIGLGIYGGVMAGWMRGLVYGAHMKGERYSLYVDGKTYTNAPLTELVTTSNEQRTPVYAVTSLSTDIYAKGKAILQNGEARIQFDPTFLQLASEKPEDMVINITATSANKGLYISAQDATGFTIRENEISNRSISLNWMALATRKESEATKHSPELLRKDFDSKMNGVMFNDNNTKDQPGHIWWDGKEIRFDKPLDKRENTK